MAWTGTVISRQVRSGVYEVTLEFTDGTRTLTETYRSNAPDADWIPRTVYTRSAELEGLFAFDVPVGPVTPEAPPGRDQNEQLFLRRVAQLPQWQTLVATGVIAADHPALLARIAWLQARIDTYASAL